MTATGAHAERPSRRRGPGLGAEATAGTGLRGGSRAAIAFTVLIAITPATPHIGVAGSFLDFSDLTTVAAALVGLVAVWRRGSWREFRVRRAPDAFAMALIIPFTLIAALLAGSAHSLAAGPARWILNAVVVALAYLLLRDRVDGARMIRALVLVSVFEAVFGLVSYALRWYGPGGLIGISYTEGVIGGMFVWGRITGTTAMASTFIGGFFAMTLPMAVGLAMAARRRARWGWWISAVLILLALVFTLSRTPIALAGAAVVILLLAAARPRVWVPIVAVCAVAFFATPLRARMFNFDNDRLALWDAGWRMFLDHPWFGVGPDQYMKYFDLYKNTPFGVATATPHNSLLYLGAESGVFAAVALGVAIAFSLRFFRSRNPLILGPMLGLAVFVVDAMTTNLYSIPSIAITAWMVAPAVAPMIRAEGRRRADGAGGGAGGGADGGDGGGAGGGDGGGSSRPAESRLADSGPGDPGRGDSGRGDSGP